LSPYASGASASETDDKENKNNQNVKKGQISKIAKHTPKVDLDSKDFSKVTNIEPKTLEEIEANIWKYNI
jgi:hypothetical protein